ncbi:MAG: glucosamine-6-phosphate deaminase [Firmicutes bacterium HGW-Firmicutes-1]|jgi:glucosamine-6-phosphate deaminase|nr:MAG: glucosamine-6-phosphate deaminase [Firmicutes bacterium HGW-Firmicutes-1]
MKIKIGNVTILITESYQELSKKAASIVAAQVIIKPNSTLGLATGSTPAGMYNEMVLAYENDQIDYSEIRSFNLDEYYPIKKHNPQSYAYYMEQKLFKHINVSKDRSFIPNGECENVVEECKAYDEKIQVLGGIDLQVLGIGVNGHIGFNEPNVHFESRTHLVYLDDETIEANSRFFSSKEEVPTRAISMGIRTIMDSKKILLLASGSGKAEIIYNTIFGEISPNVPASILQLHRDVTIILDNEAAEQIIKKNQFSKKKMSIICENVPINPKHKHQL